MSPAAATAATAARTASTAPTAGGRVRAADAEQAGRRVEEILNGLAATGDRDACAAAEELVRTLMEFYGAGLARVLDLLGTDAAQHSGTAPLDRLLRDELVSGLLVLHDLHPEDTATRIARALDSLPGRPVELVGFQPDSGVLRVRSTSEGGCGCPSTNAAARQSVEDALACFASEVTSVELESAGADKEPVLLQITTRPGLAPVTAS
jgi:Fe-S cluster biogenesis protein NfuA